MSFDRILMVAVIAMSALIAAFSLNSFPGSPTVLVAFLAACALAVVGGWGFRPTYFSRIASIFLYFGFALKFAANMIFGVSLIEPVGTFDFTAGAWDETLFISTVGLLGFLAGHCAVALLPSLAPRDTVTRPGFHVWGWWLLGVSLVLSAVLIFFNNQWSIYQIGVVPKVSLPGLAHAIIAFGTTWGAAIWIGAICYWLVEAGKLSRIAALIIILLVGLAVTISIGGRAQFLLYAIGATLFLHTSYTLPPKATSFKAWSGIAVLIALMLGLSVGAVSIQRAFTFSMAVNEPVVQAAAEEDSQAPTEYGQAIEHHLSFLPREIASLFVMRWLGLEGVMAVQSNAERGTNLFNSALIERDQGVDSIYQRIANTQYQRLEGFNFQTLAGPIAVAYYTGQPWMVFVLVMLFSAALGGVEKILGRATNASLPVAIASAGLSYYFVQTTFPRYTFIFVAEVIFTLVLIALFSRFFVREPR